MMVEVFDWQTVVDPQTTLDDAINRLLAGQVLELPSESGPVAVVSALIPSAIARFHSRLQVVVRDGNHAREWWPWITPVTQRLIRRFWPGSLMIGFPAQQGQKMLKMLPSEIQERLPDDSQLVLRSPRHDAIHELLDRFPGPILLGQATTVDWRLTDSAIQSPDEPTLVSVNSAGCRVIQAGTIRQEMINHLLSRLLVVFVCTGNTCRSAMAESLFKRLLSQRLACRIDQLSDRGIQILSAGLAAQPGHPAADQACQVVDRYGSSLEHHQSRFLDPELASAADYLITMTRNHGHNLRYYYAGLNCEPRLLSVFGHDIADPIGQGPEVYEACGREIWESLQPLVEEICADLNNSPKASPHRENPLP